MDSLLAPHIRHLSATAASIATLPFAAPKIFTNALLRSTDIVSLIRDTDTHERALFTESSAQRHALESSTKPGLDKPRLPIAPRRNTAVYSVLGGDMVAQLRKGGAGGVGSGVGGLATGEVDVELLLLGAEKLISVYHIPGATERIESARDRHDQLTESVANYDALVEAQRSQLALLHRRSDEEEHDLLQHLVEFNVEQPDITNEMIEEERKIRELEARKGEMELKIKGIDLKMSNTFSRLS